MSFPLNIAGECAAKMWVCVCVSSAASDALFSPPAALHLARSFFFLPIISLPLLFFFLTAICLASISIILIWHILTLWKNEQNYSEAAATTANITLFFLLPAHFFCLVVVVVTLSTSLNLLFVCFFPAHKEELVHFVCPFRAVSL